MDSSGCLIALFFPVVTVASREWGDSLEMHQCAGSVGSSRGLCRSWDRYHRWKRACEFRRAKDSLSMVCMVAGNATSCSAQQGWKAVEQIFAAFADKAKHCSCSRQIAKRI